MVIELKKPGVPARATFDENLPYYKQQIPALFWTNALLIASNRTDSRISSLPPIGAAESSENASSEMLAEIEALDAGSLESLQRIEDGMYALILPDPLRREFWPRSGW